MSTANKHAVRVFTSKEQTKSNPGTPQLVGIKQFQTCTGTAADEDDYGIDDNVADGTCRGGDAGARH